MHNPSIPPKPESRSIEALQLLANGLKYAEVADRMGVDISSVKGHVAVAISKLAAKNPTHAVAEGFRRGLLK